MGKAHCADGGVMSLEDRFEVKCEAIPESELPACRPSENTTRFWRPLKQVSVCVDRKYDKTYSHYVDGTANLICRCMNEFGAQRSRSVIWVCFWWEQLFVR